MKNVSKLLPVFIIAFTLAIIWCLGWFKENVTIFDFLYWIGLIDIEAHDFYNHQLLNEKIQYEGLSPSDMISLIGTIGQFIIGLLGLSLTYWTAKKNGKANQQSSE